MKDDRTMEQKERDQYQDDFLQDVKNATGKKKKTLTMKPNAETTAREKNVDVNALEKVYQQNKKDVNDENVTNMINPKYQSPKSDQKKNIVNDAIKTGGIKVRKVLGD